MLVYVYVCLGKRFEPKSFECDCKPKHTFCKNSKLDAFSLNSLNKQTSIDHILALPIRCEGSRAKVWRNQDGFWQVRRAEKTLDHQVDSGRNVEYYEGEQIKECQYRRNRSEEFGQLEMMAPDG